MGQIIIPFLEYFFLQIMVVIIGLNIVREKEIGPLEVLKSWIFGQMLLFAVLQLIAIPMILLRWKFDMLFWSFTLLCIVLIGFGIWRLVKKGTRIKFCRPELSSYALILFIIAGCLIFWQAGVYLFGVHLDQDDARWLVEANDALEYGDLMTRNYDTGEYLGRFMMPEDATSPWPMMWAIASRILHTRTSIFTHTIYAPIELLLMYSIYWLIGSELLIKLESKISFLILVAVINLYFAGTVYLQSVFSLVRIWQGKANVAAILIPLLGYLFICIHQRNETEDWIKVLIVGTAGCLMSGMGIFISALMIAVYGLYNILAYQNWKRVPLWVIALIPSIFSILVNFAIKR